MIYIIIVNYNSFPFTEKCVNSIFKSNFKRYKIILIDNKSTDNSVINIKQYIKIFNKSIKFISNNINKGYAAGVNVGIKDAINKKNCKYLLILNNDTLITPGCLNELINNYKNNSIVTPSIFDYDINTKVQSLGGSLNRFMLTTKHLKRLNADRIDYIPGTAMFFSKDIINIIGFLPEEYFMYYEDVDWSTSAMLNNISLKVNDKAIIYHKNKQKVSFYIKVRTILNRILYCNKYFRYKLPFVIILSLFNIFLNPIKKRWIILHQS